MKEVTDRLSKFIDHKAPSVRSFEEESRITIGVVQKAIRNGSSFGIDKLKKIADNNPELNLNWLFLGKENMVKSNFTYKENNIHQDGSQNQSNIEGDNTQTNYVSEPSVGYQKESTQENESSMIEILRKELEEKNKLIQEQREEIKDYKEIVKKKDERITELTDKLIATV